ncbi:MAG: HAD family phosphatase [Nanoarchaeota archaeon]|nr:HAD family phosphatase [Nanoarchaeota archaeon]
MTAVIFDMDGVLSDTNYIHLEARQVILRSLNIPFRYSEDGNGLPDEVFFGALLAKEGMPGNVSELVERKRFIVRNRAQHEAKPMPGAIACVRQLAAVFPVAVATTTHSSVAMVILETIGLRSLFPVIVTGEEVENGKPAPDIFLRTAEKLHVPPATCVVIEDSQNGVRGARKAGMKVIGVPDPRYHPDLSAADRQVASLNEVTPDLIRALVG